VELSSGLIIALNKLQRTARWLFYPPHALHKYHQLTVDLKLRPSNAASAAARAGGITE
jgi:hypothetical protein